MKQKTNLFLLLVMVMSLLTNNYAFAFKTAPKDSSDKDQLVYAEKVKEALLHSWNAYKKYAWGHDQLKPLSKSYKDWYGESLLMTPVDAFDTMILMGLKKEAEEAKHLIFEKLSFDKNISVQNFEVTIRLLGGLLSAYQLDGDGKFLTLAEDLGKRLLPVFNSPTGMPYGYVNLVTGEVKGNINNPAEIGTLMLEFGTLSKITNNPIFYDKAKKAVVELFKRRSEIGLVGTTIDIRTGEWKDGESHISGMIDSYYEYLLKSWKLFDDPDFKNMYDESITAVNKYLSEKINGQLWYCQADMNTGKRTTQYYGALDAYFPAVLALGGDLERAKQLEESCYKMWTLHGIEPEQFNYATNEVVYPEYELRPEIIESAYYLYHFTKDPKYISMGKTFFDSILKFCKDETGFAALKSVISKEKKDSMESFFLAETLKYFYLLFMPQETFDFEKYVFNTEAHPLKKLSR